MEFHIHSDGKQLGPFSIDAIKEMVKAGKISDTDLAWHEGAPDWVPLKAVPAYLAVPISTGQTMTGAVPVAAIETPTIQRAQDASLVLGIVGGTVAALIGGSIWAAIGIFLNIELGWLAIGIGAFCGIAVLKLSRGGTGLQFQMIAVLTSLLGIVVGKYGLFFYYFDQGFFSTTGTHASIFSGVAVRSFVEILPEMVGLFDALWVILAVTTAWKIPHPAQEE
jgi:hypothetical protein